MRDSRGANRSLAAWLKGVAYLYGAAMRLRARLFAKGQLASHRLPCKVVSVGNITLGGTGKTPVSLFMARLIHKAGYRVAVVSRGYKGRAEHQGGIVSDGQTLQMAPADAGDEPYLMARHLLPRGIPVIVGSDRVRSGWLAIEHFDTEVIVLDDGFQHMRLQRDFNLVLIDAGQPFGNGYLLPRGTLREPLSALARADVCLLTRCPREIVAHQVDPEIGRAECLPPRIRQRGVFPASHVPFAAEWIPVATNDHRKGLTPGEVIPDRPIFAFSGIARNEDFQATLCEMGCDLRGWKAFEDHHTYSREDLAAIEALAVRQGAELMITTEKDRVKIDTAWIRRMPLLVVGVQIDLGVYTGDFQRFVFRKLEINPRAEET